jgi:hypothetical protein
MRSIPLASEGDAIGRTSPCAVDKQAIMHARQSSGNLLTHEISVIMKNITY